MPAPLVAAIPTVASFIARHGATKAVKKYGRKAVTEARKHMKDMTTKKSKGQAQSEKATKGQRTYRSGQRKAGVAGGAVVAGGASVGAKKKKPATSRLPLAKPGIRIDTRGTANGIKHYPKGKQVRLK